MADNGIINVSGETTEGQGTPSISATLINANTLEQISDPTSSLSIIVVDKTTNTGYLIDYNTLATVLLDKLYSETMPDDGLKVYFIE